MTKQRMTIIRNNKYPEGSDQWMAYDQGWCDGYDSNEEVWVKQMLPIVGELEEHIRYDWENNDCLQVSKIKMIFDVFWQYSPEHDWLEGLVKDAVEVYNDYKWELSAGELEDLRYMARKFNVSMSNRWMVTMTYSTELEVEATDEDDANQKAADMFRSDYSVFDVVHDAEFEAEEL